MTAPKTTAPAKSAPAKTAAPVESEAAKASRTAPLDLSAFAPAKAAAPVRAAGAGRKPEDNSVAEKWVVDSWNARGEGEKVGAGYAVTLPSVDAAKTVVSKLRRAAKDNGLGLAVRVIEGDKGTATVNYAAKVAKQSKATEK